MSSSQSPPAITGTVQFAANGTALGSAAVANGQAQIATTALPAGALQVQANYTGDSNFGPSTGFVSVTVIVPDFTIAAAAPLVITAGQTGTATLTITPLTTYASTVALSCGSSSPPIERKRNVQHLAFICDA